LSIAATRATLEHVLTDGAFEQMIDTAAYFAAGVQSLIDQHRLPWSLSQLGARAEYRFADPAPRDGTESAASADAELEDLIHLYLLNRGISPTPFHNMALMSPVTTIADIDLHHSVFGAVIGELRGGLLLYPGGRRARRRDFKQCPGQRKSLKRRMMGACPLPCNDVACLLAPSMPPGMRSPRTRCFRSVTA
jgi:hypothetical protein